MPVSWTAEQDQRLLLVALRLGMIDAPKLADAWSKEYPDLGLSASAIRQHLTKLRNKVTSGGGAKTKGGGGSARATPKAQRTKAPKTPTTSGKREKAAMSDEDDSEDERTMMKEESPTKRREVSRRSKTPKRYAEPASDEEAEDERADSAADGYDARSGAAKQEADEDVFGGMDGVEVQHRSFDAMSEISKFDPENAFD